MIAKVTLLEAALVGRRGRERLGRVAAVAPRSGSASCSRSPANRAASSPPVPARISTITFLSSFGSRSTIARRISSASSSSRAGASATTAFSSASSPSSASSSARALEVVAEPAVLGRQLVGVLELAVLAPDLGVALPVPDHRRVGHLRLQLRVAALDLVDELRRSRAQLSRLGDTDTAPMAHTVQDAEQARAAGSMPGRSGDAASRCPGDADSAWKCLRGQPPATGSSLFDTGYGGADGLAAARASGRRLRRLHAGRRRQVCARALADHVTDRPALIADGSPRRCRLAPGVGHVQPNVSRPATARSTRGSSWRRRNGVPEPLARRDARSSARSIRLRRRRGRPRASGGWRSRPTSAPGSPT